MRVPSVARLCLLIAVGIAALRLLGPAPLELLDLKVLDFRHVLRGRVAPGGEVVVVGIDEASLDAIGRWPWPRSTLADLVERLGPASVVGFDIVFDQPDTSLDWSALQAAVAANPARPSAELLPALGPDHDTQLATAIRRQGRVVLGQYFEFSGTPDASLGTATARLRELPVRAVRGASPETSRVFEAATRAHVDVAILLEAAAGAGHINFLPDADGLYRRVPLAVRAGDRIVPAFAVELVRRHLGGAAPTLTLAPEGVTRLAVAGRDLPVDAAAQLWIDYLGPPRTIRHLAAADLLAGRVPPEAVAGKIAIVGFTAAGFDEIATPFTAVAPGVELEATLVDNMLHARSLRRPWWVVPFEAVVVVLLGGAVGVALQHLRALGGAAAALVLLAAYGSATQLLFVHARLVLGMVYPLGAIVFCTLGGAVFQSLTEEREKRQIRNAFRLYLNPEVTDLLASHPEKLRLGGERRPVTVLFSDIRGFTGIAEGLPPETLGELLNEYLGAMTDIVFRHEGLLDKYIGDAVMAFWGAPVPTPDHAARCCHAALDMLAALVVLHDRWRTAGLPLLAIRVGINSGEAAVGNFGSARRFSYTAMGDGVNLASRLEGLNSQYGTTVLISDATRQAIGEAFVCREIDRVRVVGRQQPVAVHELLGRRADDQDGMLAQRAEAFGAALSAYRRCAWHEAMARLEALGVEWPDDRGVAALLERCRRFREAPPPDGWDGVSDAVSK
jgi:adenylate cyclase